jgi:hypothetical protein
MGVLNTVLRNKESRLQDSECFTPCHPQLQLVTRDSFLNLSAFAGTESHVGSLLMCFFFSLAAL